MSDDVENPRQGEPLDGSGAAHPGEAGSRARGAPEAPGRARGAPEAPIPFRPPRRRRRRKPDGSGRPSKPRLRKLRFFSILIGFITLAFISTVFGMMMAVASDIPLIENEQQYNGEHNSFLYDDHWRPMGLFAPPNHVVIDSYSDISGYMRDAIVSIEDKRFWTNPGVDIRGIARAFVADVTGGARQGASTITQQFVKNALSEQNNRTIFEKLREAALAYHLTRKWSKQKILTQYLNSIYFGNGAYGVESAARVYFGWAHGFNTQPNAVDASSTSSTGCGDGTTGSPAVQRPKCASVLAPWEAALLAGMVASPAAFDPVADPVAARDRRDEVLKDMLRQQYITGQQYDYAIKQPLPKASQIQQPTEPSAAPYFTSWLRPQILAAMGLGRGVPASVAEYRAYYGGLRIRTSLDLELQRTAEQAISQDLPTIPGQQPAASLVAIDNATGEVRAMVGGPIVNGHEDYSHSQFNLATEGHRQPGSAFKPFTLAVALESGFGPDSLFTSAPADFIVPNSAGKEHFIVHNFGNTYSGTISLAGATAISDNSVYARLGIEGLGRNGTKRVARMANRMGIRSPVSSNYAMILGGLQEGVSPLDMAHAYETFATLGKRFYNPQLGDPDKGPTGIAQINCPVCRTKVMLDHPTYQRVLPPAIAQEVHYMLTGVVQSGTGTAAAISGVDVAGKTGTTSNYGDAWFVGWTPQMTVAVWMGVPDRLVSMATDYNGGPVEGGTYPAIIWHDFMVQALPILAREAQSQSGHTNPNTTTTTTTGPAVSTNSGSGATPIAPTSTTPQNGTTNGAGGATTNGNGAATGGGGGPAATGTGGGGAAGGTGGGGGAGGGGATGGGGGGAGGGGGTGGGGGGTGAGGTGSGGGGGGNGSGGAGLGGGGH
jgi:penicillin-binding protein 1A